MDGLVPSDGEFDENQSRLATCARCNPQILAGLARSGVWGHICVKLMLIWRMFVYTNGMEGIMIARFLGGAAVVAIIGCTGASSAFADAKVLPDPTLGGLLEAGAESVRISGPGPHTLSNAGSTAFAILPAEPFPSVFASAKGTSPGLGPLIASFAELDYDVEVTGPTPNVLVDVSGWASVSPAFGPNVALYVNGPFIFSLGDNPHSDITTLFFDITVSLPTGSVVPVELNANTGDNVGPFSESAYIDPYFSIDPSNADPSAYAILTSPGVGNVPSPGVPGTPETSTWAMMLLGFSGLGWAGWRRRSPPVTVGL